MTKSLLFSAAKTAPSTRKLSSAELKPLITIEIENVPLNPLKFDLRLIVNGIEYNIDAN